MSFSGQQGLTIETQGALKLGDRHTCIIILAIITGMIFYAIIKMQRN